MSTMTITGTEPMALTELRKLGVDHGGNPVRPFIDSDGGWPLRCCLRDSNVGDELAIVSWSPFPWPGAYRELGPIVIHAAACPSRFDGSFPDQFETRRQVVRPYHRDRSIEYGRIELVEPGAGLESAIGSMLEDAPDVEFVHARNVLSGCWSFTATR